MNFPDPFYRWRPHPWHGLEIGPRPPGVVHAYIEMTPFDLVKYEVDKITGYLRVDRPQRGSSHPPALYGFIPRTYCGNHVGALCPGAAKGDGDPLDICVISERPINRTEVVMNARVVGGIQLLDRGDADDKIIAVLDSDSFWSNVTELDHVPPVLVERLRHYFSTYKLVPGEDPAIVVKEIYGRERALQVVEASMRDYAEAYGADPASARSR